MKSRSTTLLIRTPEGIVFSQTLAGPVTRMAAWLIDMAAINLVMQLALALIIPLGFVSLNLAVALYIVAYFVVSIGYGIFFEWVWRGQTLGKKLLRLRVVDVEGMRLQFNQIVTRNLLRFVDSLPMFYFVGGLTCWLNRHCQRLGDIAANTVVIRSPQIAEPDLDRLLDEKFNSLRQHPHLAARLRQRITPAEADIALQALMRRDEFEPAARVELFAELAAHFRSKVELPPETTDGVPAEQFIRNLTSILYRPDNPRRSETLANHR